MDLLVLCTLRMYALWFDSGLLWTVHYDTRVLFPFLLRSIRHDSTEHMHTFGIWLEGISRNISRSISGRTSTMHFLLFSFIKLMSIVTFLNWVNAVVVYLLVSIFNLYFISFSTRIHSTPSQNIKFLIWWNDINQFLCDTSNKNLIQKRKSYQKCQLQVTGNQSRLPILKFSFYRKNKLKSSETFIRKLKF